MQLSAITRPIFLHPICYSGRLKIVQTAQKHRTRCAGADQSSTLLPWQPPGLGFNLSLNKMRCGKSTAQTKPGSFGDKVNGVDETSRSEQFLLFPKVLGGKGQVLGTGRLWCHSLLSSHNKDAERRCRLGDLEQTWVGISNLSLLIPLIQRNRFVTHLVNQAGMESSCSGQIPKAICSSSHWQIPASGCLTPCFGTCTAQGLCWRAESSIIWGSGAAPHQDLEDFMAQNKERFGCHREAWPDRGKNILNLGCGCEKRKVFHFILLLPTFKSCLRG